MSNSPFYYINAICNHEDVEVGKDFNKFLTTRFFSLFQDTIFIANLANEENSIDNNYHFKYYRSLVTKKKRFTKWPKQQDQELINSICEFFDFSPAKALESLTILNDEQLSQIKERHDERK